MANPSSDHQRSLFCCAPYNETGGESERGWNGVQSYSVSRFDDFGYQITPITSPNYKTIWISSKHRVVVFNPVFFGSQETLGQHTHFCIFLLPSHRVIQRLVWHTSEIFIKPSKPKGHKVTNYQDTFVFQESEGIEQPNKAAHLFVACFHHATRPFERRRFFEGLGGCRRRGASGGWEQQPVAEAVARGGGFVMRGRFELKGWIFFLLKVEMWDSL